MYRCFLQPVRGAISDFGGGGDGSVAAPLATTAA
jgi:hypothetical protein